MHFCLYLSSAIWKVTEVETQLQEESKTLLLLYTNKGILNSACIKFKEISQSLFVT